MIDKKQLFQPFGEERGMAGAEPRAKVLDLDVRELRLRRAFRKLEQAQRALGGFVKSLNAGGRRA